MNKQKVGKNLIWLISVLATVGVFFVKPIPQDLSYHDFVDQREFFSIPNFWNVISNFPFFIVGLIGLAKLQKLKIIEEIGVAYWLLFFGVMLVAFGSGYYHFYPSNSTLVWDRLPMTIAFMSLFAIIIAEFVDERKGALLLIPMIVIGVASVFYWQAYDDLRFYALVQFLPLLLIPVILLCYPTSFVNVTGYWLLLAAYIVAKIFEHYDTQIFKLLGGSISGHSIKHIIAALGIYFLFKCYRGRLSVFLIKK